jgi:circadian clock protein KaiC
MPGEPTHQDAVSERVSSGVVGLDEVLGGGFPANRLHLIEGAPGTGKTTLALQFLLAGARQGESVLYVTLSETIEELRAVARSHGWDLAGLALREFTPTEESLTPEEQYTILHPTEVELGETIWAVLEELDRTKPTRVVLDSLAELYLLARDNLRYRRQILGLKRFFAGRRCTVLLLDGTDETAGGLQSVAHSVVQLEQLAPEYGGARRRLRVPKLRGSRYRGGYHDLVIRTGGLTVFPRLVAGEHREPFPPGLVSSAVPELDSLLGGGLDRGTSTLLIGPAGVGKSVMATQYAVAAAERGERGTIYVFDESIQTFVTRSAGLGLGLRQQLASGRISLHQLDRAQLSPGQLDHLVRQAVESDGVRVVVIDSLNGYLNAMSEERFVLVQLHELLTYLGQQGGVTLMTLAQHGMVGDRPHSPLDVSYLADTVVLLRYFEAVGQLRQAISVVKKRSGAHERSIRELKLGPGVRVGEPLREFQGVLAGSPSYLGSERSLLDHNGPRGDDGDGQA